MTDRNDRIREIAYFLWLEKAAPKAGRSVIGPWRKPWLIPSLLSASASKANLPANR